MESGGDQGDQEKAAVSPGRTGPGGGRRWLHVAAASALLIIPSREVQSGSFSTGGFWSSLRAKNVTVGHLSPVQTKTRTSGPHCLLSPAEGAGTVSVDSKALILWVHEWKFTIPVTQIDRAKASISWLFHDLFQDYPAYDKRVVCL